LKNSDGKITNAIIQHIDITKRKLAEEELREKEQKYRLLFESANDGIFILDKTGFIDCNQKGAEMYGLTKDEVIGHSPIEFSPERQPDGRLSSEVADKKNRAALNDVPQVFDWRPLRADGSPFDVEITLNRLELGGKMCLQAIVRDITERKRAEENLRLSKERFETIFNEAPLGTALIDSLTGHIYAVNPMFAKIAGRTIEEMANIDWMSISHPDDIQEDLDNMALLNAGKISGFQMRKRSMHPDGTAVWISMTIAPMRVEDKAHPRHLCMIQDITEHLKLEEQLRHSQKMETVGVLAGGVAHDFNNILMAIVGYGDLAKERLNEDEKTKEYIEEILAGANRAAELTRGLLAFSRKQVIRPEPQNLNSIVFKIEKMLHRIIGEDIELITVLSDRDLIEIGRAHV
jgi:PAS domain S-box-containing protein